MKALQDSYEIKELVFQKVSSLKEVKDELRFDIEAFADLPGDWSEEAMKTYLGQGWMLYDVHEKSENVNVAFILIKVEGNSLLTKDTAIKMEFKGNSYSHYIKEFYEKVSKELSIGEIIHFCTETNFRMVALNEKHGYLKTAELEVENEKLLEWTKKVG